MIQLRITNGFEKMTDLDFLGKVRYIVTEMAGNTNFTTPSPTLDSISTLANEFDVLISAAEAGGTQDKLVRDTKKEELIIAMHNLSAYVLFVAKGDRVIAGSSGFTVAKDPTPQSPIEKATGIELTDGPNAGEMQLVFKAVKGAKSYAYQISLDPLDETKWVTAYGTTRKNLFTGLDSGKKYYVRVAAMGNKKQFVYSDVFARVAQ